MNCENIIYTSSEEIWKKLTHCNMDFSHLKYQEHKRAKDNKVISGRTG